MDGNGDTNADIDLGALEYNSSSIQEIHVLGNGTSIRDGDIIPVPWDDTDFGNAVVGGDSVQRTFTIQNPGANPLELSATDQVEITGTNAGDFSVTTQPDATINGGDSTNFTIEFTPAGTGLREATVRILNNDSNESEFTFAIQGFGDESPTAQEIAVFGLGEEILDNDSTPSTLDGTDFSNTPIGGAGVQSSFTISNTGEDPLQLTGTSPIEIVGTNAADFSVTTQPESTVNGGQSVIFTIKFTPSALGQRDATVRILSNDSNESEFTFAIQGYGEEPPSAQEIVIHGNGEEILDEDSTPSNLDGTDFGDVAIGGEGVQSTFYIGNTGDEPLQLTGTSPVEITGTNVSDFSVVTQPSTTVNGGKSVNFTIKFIPTASGLRKATVRILCNDSDEGEFTFAIQGNGANPPEISVKGKGLSISDSDGTPSLLDGTDFGNADIGGSAVQTTFTIENTGDLPLNLTGMVEIDGTNPSDFIVTAQPNSTINGGSSTTFDISFSPSGEGRREARVHIHNNDADEGGFNFLIQGNGVRSSGEEFFNYLPIIICTP